MMQKDIVDAIVASLEGDAPDWEFTAYRATNNKTKTEIWIANKRYGIHVDIGDGPRYGTNIAVIPLASWRWRIYRAAMNAAQRRQLKVFQQHWKAA